MIGLPEKWLENIVLENIQVENTNVGARITRVKNLTLKNVQINSDERAMIATDVYEMVFKNVTLKDDSDGLPLLFEGRYTDAIFMEDYPMNQIQFNDGLSAEIIKEEPMQKVW